MQSANKRSRIDRVSGTGTDRDRRAHWRSPVVLSVIIAAIALISFAPLTDTTPGRLSAAPLTIEDINPNSSSLGSGNSATGGRHNGMATVSNDKNIIYAASEWGGLYKTTDGGDKWSHVDSLLPTVLDDVEVNPGNTGTIYATSFYDGRVNSQAGISVSFDGGVSWSHPASTTPPPAYNCAATRKAEPAAFGIGVRPDATQNVFIGTNCGVARSTDGGVTWNFVDPTPGDPASNVWDVVVQGGGPTSQGIVDICGDDRHYRSTDGGTTWTGGSAGLPAGQCSIAASPDESYVLLATVGQLIFESDDGGATWPTQLTNAAGGGSRNPYVATNQRADSGGNNVFDLWFGGTKINQTSCTTPATPAPGGTARCPTNSWNAASTGSHDDQGDIVFDPTVAVDACPMIASNDGGVYRNTACQTPTWTQPTVSPHALWLYAMAGAHQAGATNEDLYLGAQDDGTSATTTAGTSSPAWTQTTCCDVFNIVADSTRVVSDSFSGYSFTRWNSGMTGGTAIATLPPNVPEQGYALFNFADYIAEFGANQYIAVSRTGAYITSDITSSPVVWTQIGASSTPAGGWCGVQAAVIGGLPTFYAQTQCIGVFETQSGAGLWKYSGTAPGGTWTQVDTNSGLTGGFGIFAVDPKNPNRLYASNLAAGGPKMVFSNDGGLTWTTDAQLDKMMTGNGFFKYQTASGPTSYFGFKGYVQPTLVAFDPGDSNVIVAGGRDSGVFLSTNAGKTWGLLTDPYNSNVSGVPHLPRPWFAYFDHEPATPTKVYIGTQGRGVWRLTLPTADVSVTKYDSPDPAIAGGQLYYTITATNNGPDVATNVTINDVLPPQVKFITDDLAACVEAPVGTINCNLGTLANGGSRTVVVKVEVKANTVANAGGPTSIQNVATVSSSGAVDSDFSNNSSAVVGTIIEDSSDLRVTKVCKPDAKLLAGQTGTCTIYVDNLGPSDARNVRVTDSNLSIGSFTIGTITASQGSCSKAGGIVTCNLGTLPAASLTSLGRATIAIDVSANEEMQINDVATVASDTPDPVTSNNQATGSISVQALSNLGITKSAPATVVAGTPMTYTVNLTNGGPSTARNVVIKDDLPAGVTVSTVGASGGPASCNAGVPGDPFRPTTCAFDSVAPSTGRTMTVVVNVNTQTVGTLHNDARVSSDTLDTDNSNDLAHTDTAVTPQADLSTIIAATPSPVIAGRTLSYQITVTNNGPSTATTVTLTDTLPAVLTFTSTTTSTPGGTCGLQVNTNIVQCQLGRLDPGQSAVAFIYTNVSPSAVSGSTINDSATASSATTDLVPGNNTGSVATAVLTSADVGITLGSDKDVYKPSTVIHYTITVTNGGSSDAQSVNVTQALPPTKSGFYVSNNIGCPAPVGTTFTCALGTIPAGGTRTFQLNFMIRGNKGTISSTASMTSTTPDPNSVNNSSTRVVTVK